LVAVATALSLLATGCPKSTPKAEVREAGADAGKPEGIPVNLTLDAAQKKAAKELVGSIKNGRFPNEAVRDKSKAKLFLYLAATSKKPEVVMAALQAMKMAFTSSEAYKKKEYAGKDYATVVAAHLDSKDLKIQGYALEAAPHAVSGKQPDASVVEALVKIASSHPNVPARAEAIDRLRLVRNFQQDQKIANAFLQALDSDQAYVVSKALFGLRLRATGLVMRNKFLGRARKLMQHTDPGVRGRAAELAGRLGAGKPPVVREVVALLADKHPFTRSAACSALAHMGDLASVHAIIKLVDDTEKNTYDIRGFQTPTGRAGWVHHDGSAWSRVQDAAIRALERLSMRTGTRFKADRVDSKDVERSLSKNARAAKAWYAKVKAKLPKPVETPEDTAETKPAAKAGAGASPKPEAVVKPKAAAQPKSEPAGKPEPE
jgi:HEAT repeat protein